MTKQKKHRLNTNINMDTYDELNDFIKNNEVITSKLNKGTVITIALNLLYKTTEHTDISQLMMEYLQDHNTVIMTGNGGVGMSADNNGQN